MVEVHTFNSRTLEAEAGGSQWVQDQPDLQKWVPGQNRETMSQNIKKKKKKKKKNPTIGTIKKKKKKTKKTQKKGQ